MKVLSLPYFTPISPARSAQVGRKEGLFIPFSIHRLYRHGPTHGFVRAAGRTLSTAKQSKADRKPTLVKLSLYRKSKEKRCAYVKKGDVSIKSSLGRLCWPTIGCVFTFIFSPMDWNVFIGFTSGWSKGATKR